MELNKIYPSGIIFIDEIFLNKDPDGFYNGAVFFNVISTDLKIKRIKISFLTWSNKIDNHVEYQTIDGTSTMLSFRDLENTLFHRRLPGFKLIDKRTKY